MGVNSLPMTVTRQRRDCDLNPGLSAPEFSTLTTRLPSHQGNILFFNLQRPWIWLPLRPTVHSKLQENSNAPEHKVRPTFVWNFVINSWLRTFFHSIARPSQRVVNLFDRGGHDTIRCAILTCARKPTWVSFIYRTETTTQTWTTEKLKSKKRICSEVTVNSPEKPCSQSWRRKGRLRWEGWRSVWLISRRLCTSGYVRQRIARVHLLEQFACGLSRISWTFFRLNDTQALRNGKIVSGAVRILYNAKIVFSDHPTTLTLYNIYLTQSQCYNVTLGVG